MLWESGYGCKGQLGFELGLTVKSGLEFGGTI